jgi:formylglycine-generating enzyme
MFTFKFLAPYLILFFSILFYSNCVNNELPNTKLKLSNSKIPQFDMVFVEGGTFIMGCNTDYEEECLSEEHPRHPVIILDYFIGRFEVTQEQWVAIMHKNPSHNQDCSKCPVSNVNWDDVQLFINLLKYQTGIEYRLPTEAEWEYAARGGKKSKNFNYSGSNDVNEVSWHNSNSARESPSAVGLKKPNELGLFDMSGNVWERCNDWYSRYLIHKQVNPKGPNDGTKRVIRGGGWTDELSDCRTSNRYGSSPEFPGGGIGFRLVYSK